MVQISAENDKLEIQAGTTVAGRPLVIVPTQTGLYRIEARGGGGAHPLEDQLFTTLLLAQRALDNYRRANVAAYAKEQLKQKIVSSPTHKEQRKMEAMRLKNGELSVPGPEDEE